MNIRQLETAATAHNPVIPHQSTANMKRVASGLNP